MKPPGFSISLGFASEMRSDPGLSADLKVAASKWRFEHRVDAGPEPGRRAQEQRERLIPAGRNELDGEHPAFRVRGDKAHPLTAHPKVEAQRIQDSRTEAERTSAYEFRVPPHSHAKYHRVRTRQRAPLCRRAVSAARRQLQHDMNEATQPTVFVDGNNVMGSRADGWWRNRAEASKRLVAEIAPLARNGSGVWTVVFDGSRPRGMAPPHERLAVVHTGHGRRDGADDRIVELVDALADRATALVYTSDAGLRARVHALGAEVAGARALLNEIATSRDTMEPNACGSAFVPCGPRPAWPRPGRRLVPERRR